jgi:hypothetical protein
VDRTGDRELSNYRAFGSTLGLPFFLALKAEALFAANRSSEALEAVEEAQAVAQQCEVHSSSAKLHRLRGVFLTAIGGSETPKLRLRFVKLSESRGSRSRFR